MRFLSLQLTLWASACVGPHAYPTFSRVGAAPSPGFLFSDLVVGGSFHPVHSPLRFGWRGLAATFSSVPVRCFPCCRYIGIFWASPALLACWGSWGFAPCVRVFQLRCCLLGLQVGFPCCLFLTLEWVYFWLRCLQSLWATKAVSAAVRGSSSSSCVCWSITFFWSWFLVTRWWLLLRLLVLVSSDARLHLPDTFASSSTPISGSWMVLAPAFSWALPWVLPSRFPCWLLARDD